MVSAQKVSAQKVSGHKVSKNDNIGQKVSSQKVSAQKVSGHKVSKNDTWPKKFPPKKFPKINDVKILFYEQINETMSTRIFINVTRFYISMLRDKRSIPLVPIGV